MAIQDGLRFWFAQLNLGAHFLNLRRLLFQFCFESINLLLLLREDRFTVVIHRSNPFLEALGRGRHAKLTAAIDHNCRARNWYAADTGDESPCLDIIDADRSRVASDAYQVPDIDSVIALSNKDARPCTQGDIAVASKVA